MIFSFPQEKLIQLSVTNAIDHMWSKFISGEGRESKTVAQDIEKVGVIILILSAKSHPRKG